MGLEHGEGKKGNSICQGLEARESRPLGGKPREAKKQPVGRGQQKTADGALRLREAPEDLDEGGSVEGGK